MIAMLFSYFGLASPSSVRGVVAAVVCKRELQKSKTSSKWDDIYLHGLGFNSNVEKQIDFNNNKNDSNGNNTIKNKNNNERKETSATTSTITKTTTTTTTKNNNNENNNDKNS